jgi:hypothetical protein
MSVEGHGVSRRDFIGCCIYHSRRSDQIFKDPMTTAEFASFENGVTASMGTKIIEATGDLKV